MQRQVQKGSKRAQNHPHPSLKKTTIVRQKRSITTRPTRHSIKSPTPIQPTTFSSTATPNGITIPQKRNFAVHDPRLPSEHAEIIVTMSRIRQQSWSTRLQMMGQLLWQSRSDKKEWKNWPNKGKFSAKYAIQVYKIALESIKNPTTNYSFYLHSVGKEAAEGQYPIPHHHHLVHLAEDNMFRSVFSFMSDNGIPFPWSDPKQMAAEFPKGFKLEFGVSPDVSLFHIKVAQLLHGRTITYAADTFKHEFTLPQTYGVEGADSHDPTKINGGKGIDQTTTPSQSTPTPAPTSDFSPSDSKLEFDSEHIEVVNTHEDIEELRHLQKLFKVTTYLHSLELDHSRYTSSQVSLDIARRMPIRMLAAINGPLARNRLKEALDEVDELGSFDPQEIGQWQSDRYLAVQKAIEPFLITLLTDEFKLKGQQGYVAAVDGIEGFLWDEEVARGYGQFRSVIQRHLIPPDPDNAETQQAMALEQMRRQQNRTQFEHTVKEKMEAERKELEKQVAAVAKVESSSSQPINPIHPERSQPPPQPTQSSTQNGKKKDKWHAMEEELKKMEKSGIKVRNVDDDGLDAIQFENLKAIYGENYDPHTGTFIDPSVEKIQDKEEVSEQSTTQSTQSTSQQSTSQQSPQQPQQPQQQKPTGPKPLFHPQRRTAAAPAQVGQ